MRDKLVAREVALCRKARCPILVLQEVCSGEKLVIPLGLVEACLLGCALHEGGAGTERCTALLAEALKEASGKLEVVEMVKAPCGRWWAELTFRNEDGATRSQRCRPADAAILAVAFGVPLTRRKQQEEMRTEDELAPERVSHWLATLAPDDFRRHGEDSSGDTNNP